MDKFTRACPNCDKEIKHKSLRSLRESERKKCLCRSCGAKSRVEKYGINKSFAKFAQKGHGLGNKNPFYGKTHSEETKDKIRNRDKSFFNSKEYKEKQRINSSGKNNPMCGSSWTNRQIETNVCSYVVTYPDNHTEVIINLNDFCRRHNLSAGNMCSTSVGKRKHTKGFSCVKL